jgi:hypothetical protein
VLVYVEYLSRLPAASLEQFHWVAGRQDVWSGEYEDDRLVLNIGRTFRIGPSPWYLAAWYTENAGIERLGDWERIFASGVADAIEETFKLGAQIDLAGAYDPLLEPVHRRGGLYYAEYLDLEPGASRDEVRSYYEQRAAAEPDVDLVLLCDRIGKLGPDPRLLAVWDVASWDRLDAAARALDRIEAPVRLVTAGIYRDLGAETL